jgi:hypothetical protein
MGQRTSENLDDPIGDGRTKMQTALFTVLVATLILGGILALYIAADWLELPFRSNPNGVVSAANYLSVLVAFGFVITLMMLIYLSVREWGGRLLRTAFFLPQVLKHICLVGVSAPTGLAGLDRILHHNAINWRWFTDSEVRMLELVFYFGVLVTSLWFNGAWVVTANQDHRASVRRVITVCGVAEGIVALGMIGLYLIWGR